MNQVRIRRQSQWDGLVRITSETVEFNICVSRSRDIMDFATIVSTNWQVIKEGCGVLSNTPRVGGGGSVKLYDEKKKKYIYICLKDKYMKRISGEFS